MTPGAFIFKEQVLSPADLSEAEAHAERIRSQRDSVDRAGRYAAVKWGEVFLDPQTPFCRKVLDELGADDPELLAFYYLEPGTDIHPHRDLTGASMNNRIRFHVPIVTNPGVEFQVEGEKLKMKPGDLWCLDTSYMHAVANFGDASRVHLVIECAINDRIRPAIPRNLATRLHNVKFVGLLGVKFVEAVVKNSVKDPEYFKRQMKMVGRFIGWRFLGRGRPG